MNIYDRSHQWPSRRVRIYIVGLAIAYALMQLANMFAQKLLGHPVTHYSLNDLIKLLLVAIAAVLVIDGFLVSRENSKNK